MNLKMIHLKYAHWMTLDPDDLMQNKSKLSDIYHLLQAVEGLTLHSKCIFLHLHLADITVMQNKVLHYSTANLQDLLAKI